MNFIDAVNSIKLVKLEEWDNKPMPLSEKCAMPLVIALSLQTQQKTWDGMILTYENPVIQ